MFGRVLLRDIHDISAVVSALRNLERITREFAQPRLRREREIRDLYAGVVVVELARHIPARARQHRRDGVTQRSLTAMAHMQRTGRIRTHELHDDGLAGPTVCLAIGVALIEHAL